MMMIAGDCHRDTRYVEALIHQQRHEPDGQSAKKCRWRKHHARIVQGQAQFIRCQRQQDPPPTPCVRSC